jgi:hypothetical protein
VIGGRESLCERSDWNLSVNIIYTHATPRSIMPIDMEYYESFGNPPSPECWVSIDVDEDFFRATEHALPYEPSPDGDGQRRVLALIWLEMCARDCKAQDSRSWARLPFLSTCLDLNALRDLLEAMIEEGLLDPIDSDPPDTDIHVFESITEFAKTSDQKVHAMLEGGKPQVVFDDTCFDSFDAHSAAQAGLAWLDKLSVAQLVRDEGTMRAYVELGLLVGPRALARERMVPEGQLFMAAGSPHGGELLSVVRAFYGTTTNMTAQLLGPRLGDFLSTSRWPRPYDLEFSSMEEYLMDLPARSKWQKATRSEWLPLVSSKLDAAVGQLPQLSRILRDHRGSPAMLSRDIHVLGDACLGGEASTRLPLYRIADIESSLSAHYEDYINSRITAGDSTVDMVKSVARLLRVEEGAGGSTDPAATGPDAAEKVVAPKRGQVRRAVLEGSFARLEAKWLPRLKDPDYDRKDNLTLYDECFTARSVLPKAVLLQKPGSKLPIYYSESSFLDVLKDETSSFRLYLGQAIAFDEDENEVPEELETFQLAEEPTKLTRELKWGEIDILNDVLLQVRGEELTTHFKHHSRAKLYHVRYTMELAQRTMGKYFAALGFPPIVPKGQGWSYRTFMSKMLKLNDAKMSMESAVAAGMDAAVDEYVAEAMAASAATYDRIVYGSSPADKFLGAWLESTQPVYVKIEKALKALKEVKPFKSALPMLFGGTSTAPMMPGFEEPRERRERQRDTPPGGGKPGKGKDVVKQAPPGDGKKYTVADCNNSKAARLKLNPKNVFYYDDGKFSMRTILVDWPGICAKQGWDSNACCGPVQCSLTTNKVRDYTCMDADHGCAAAQARPLGHPKPIAFA